MISQKIPYRCSFFPMSAYRESQSSRVGRIHEPLCIDLHDAPRRQGQSLDSSQFPRGSREGRLRRTLLSSGARPAGARRGRQRTSFRDRDAEARLRGPYHSHGHAESAYGNFRLGEFCRAWAQVSDLGAEAAQRASRRGQRENPRVEEVAGLFGRRGGTFRSIGMIAGRGTGQPGAAGGLARHVPVMLREALSRLSPKDGALYIDGTFGAGSYTRAILEAANCRVIGIDRDQSAIAAGAALVEEFSGRLTLVEDRFSNLDEAARNLGYTQADGVVLDIGVSSMQLDELERGFSFRGEGPLDMRMEARGTSAADVVNSHDERELFRIISMLGEEKFAR